MRYKKIMLLAIFLISLLAVGAVSAADNTTEDNMIGEDPNADLESPNTDDVLTADEQTFTHLNQAINENNNSEIYLYSNYKYSPGDDSFKEGIVINRDVTIYGNGHTINGSGQACIFKVSNNNVVFYNITFTKGNNDYDGGAIRGEPSPHLRCKAIDCTFTENHAYSGGGAMCFCTAVNCTFSRNTADRGGAMYSCSAVNCTFQNNHANRDGGAIDGGYAVNCTFTQNTVSGSYAEGGALFDSSAVNCIFINNTAIGEGSKGGAMSHGSAVNCTFSGNTIDEMGEFGNAMAFCFVANCTGQKPRDFYEVEDLTLQWTVKDFISLYYPGGELSIDLFDGMDLNVDFIDFDMVVYKNGVNIKTYHCLSGDWFSLDLAAGNYIAELIVTYPGLNQPDSKNITLTINKATPKIEVSASDVTYPGSVVVKVKSDVSGNYIVKVGDRSKDFTLIAGVTQNITFSDLVANETGYIVNVTYAETENYTKCTTPNLSVKVHKAAPTIEVTTAADVTYCDDIVVNVKTDVNGTYIIKVGDKTKNVNLVADVAQNITFSGLATNEKGYVVNVTHDSENYTGFNDSAIVKVKKGTTKLTVGDKSFKFEDKTKKYVVTLKDGKGNAIKNTRVTLKVNGITYTATTNANGVATFTLNKLTKTGNAVISYSGDNNYKGATKNVKITVKAPVFKTVSYGSKDKAMVKKIQIALKKHGFYLKAYGHYLKVDGIYHKYTVLAVKQFQKANKLKVTGKVDYTTAKKLKIVK